jgi:sulfur-carrier protein
VSDDVRVRFWAAAKAAAGVAEEAYPGPTDLAALLDAIRDRHGVDSALAVVLARCSYLVDEVSPGTRAPSEVGVPPGGVVDVLPPFAGGSGAPGEEVRGDQMRGDQTRGDHTRRDQLRDTGTPAGVEGLALA